MTCPACKTLGVRVQETRDSDLYIRRLRICFCGATWWTKEKLESGSLKVNENLSNEIPGLSNETKNLSNVKMTPTVAFSSSRSLSEVSSGSDPDLSGSDRISYKQSAKNINMMGENGAAKEGDDTTPKDNLFDRALALFCRLWKEKTGNEYLPTKGDRGQFGRMLQGIPRPLLKELPPAISAYMSDRSPWNCEKGHSMTHFASSGGFNKYRAGKPSPAPASRPLPYEPRKAPEALGWSNGERRAERKPERGGDPMSIQELLEGMVPK